MLPNGTSTTLKLTGDAPNDAFNITFPCDGEEEPIVQVCKLRFSDNIMPRQVIPPLLGGELGLQVADCPSEFCSVSL